MNNEFQFERYCDPNPCSGTVAQKTGSAAGIVESGTIIKLIALQPSSIGILSVMRTNYHSMQPITSFVPTQYSRVNQLGNADGDTIISQNELNGSLVINTKVAEGLNANRFMWKVPDSTQG